MATLCYMVVTPSALDSVGIRDTEGHMKWHIKFGDGDGEAPARYATHNPDYNLQLNSTGRVGHTLQQRVLIDRHFRNPSHSETPTEWYTLWERPDLHPPILFGDRLTHTLDAFATYQFNTTAHVTAAVNDLLTRIPAACANPPA